MNIAFVINQFPPLVTSGLGRYVEALHPHLVDRHRLTVFSVNDGHLPPSTSDGGLVVHRPMGRVLRAVFRRRRLNRTRRTDFALLALNVLAANVRHFRGLRALHRAEGLDVVAVHDVTNVLAAVLCHRFLRVPLVFHLHTTEYSLAPHRTVGSLGLGRRLERHLGRIAARVVVPSPEIRDQLVTDGWDATTIDVIAQGNPLAGAVPSGRPPELPPDRTILLFVGRLETQKGIWTLLDALSTVVAAEPSVLLVVVGEGDHDRVLAHGSRDHVLLVDRFLGRDELPAWYAAADVCVFPSLFEPFGLVAAEAMSFGRPVVLGDGFSRVFAGSPGAPAAVYAGLAGLAGVLVEVLADPVLRETLGANARAVATGFTWEATAAATLATYRAAVAGRRDAHRPATRAQRSYTRE